MLKNLEEFLYEECGDHNSDKKNAQLILDFLENAGMFPPDSIANISFNEQELTVQLMNLVSKWESENS